MQRASGLAGARFFMGWMSGRLWLPIHAWSLRMLDRRREHSNRMASRSLQGCQSNQPAAIRDRRGCGARCVLRRRGIIACALLLQRRRRYRRVRQARRIRGTGRIREAGCMPVQRPMQPMATRRILPCPLRFGFPGACIKCSMHVHDGVLIVLRTFGDENQVSGQHVSNFCGQSNRQR